MKLLTVNVGRPRAVDYTNAPGGLTGIDKQPVDGPVQVADPNDLGRTDGGGSGLGDDAVCDSKHHGGTHQAVYAYAREDLDRWERRMGARIGNGAFGENLTTVGLDVSGAKIGERWRIGDRVVLEVTSGRVPCRTFAGRMGELGLPEKGWVKEFTQRGEPGAYLKVVVPGEIRAGDPIEVVHRPDHDVTVSVAFRAQTVERSLLPSLMVAGDALNPDLVKLARDYLAKHGGQQLPV
ncbi:MOSC domain-containing protein [Streptomyces sp. NPDC017979]|uniref:MOSC domain-containing protein n=1 Tax=Streptomyces sp. NPDC017979 TaxID=3365024 RepID=UPI0037B74F33